MKRAHFSGVSSRERWPRPDTPARTRRSRCIRQGEYIACPWTETRARLSEDECSRPDRRPRRQCPWCPRRVPDDIRHAGFLERRVLQPRSITRPCIGILAALVVLACTDLRSAEQPWREAPEYLNLLAPPTRRDAYRAYVSPLDLDATLKQLLADAAVLRPPGAWQPRAMIPYDAFGLAGSYNRWKVAGLYRKPARARGLRAASGPGADGVLDPHRSVSRRRSATSRAGHADHRPSDPTR